MKVSSFGIHKIKYGEIHRFYPLKFEGNKKFEELCESIKKSEIIFKDEYQKKIMDSLGYSLSQVVKNINKEEEKGHNVIFKMQDFDKYDRMNPSNFAPNRDIRIELDDTSTSIKFSFYDMELEELMQQINRIQRVQETATEIYGKSFVALQDRFVLLPFKAVLSNGENVWLNTTLYVFANGMGLIKIEIPLINIDAEVLMKNNVDSIVQKVTNKWQNGDDILNPTVFEIINIYMKSFAEDLNIKFYLYKEGINYISLIDFEGIPKQINNVPKEIQEDLYRIIAAPVPNRKNSSYIKEAQEYIRKNSWSAQHINYLVKTTGGCLSYIDQSILDTVAEEYKETNNICSLNDYDYYNLYDIFAIDLFINVELALLIVMLKKLNGCNCYFEKVNGLGELNKIQKEYNKNIIFISELQEECYGSVSEQIDFFEKSMCYYLKENIMDKKLVAIDSILKEEEKKKEEKFQNFIAIGGFLFTLLFGLPAINDTLLIIRKAFAFWPYNVPFFTVEDFSLLLWILLNSIILFKLIKSRISTKASKISD